MGQKIQEALVQTAVIRQVVSEYTNPKREAMAFIIQSAQAIKGKTIHQLLGVMCS